MSASSKTMLGDFPPSSSVTRLIVADAISMIELPVDVSPVNATLSTPGCPARWAPITAPGPGRTLTTPGGQPASKQILPSSSAVMGVGEAGLSMIVQPAAKAGATFQAAMSRGEFHGTICAQTPTGCFRV